MWILELEKVTSIIHDTENNRDLQGIGQDLLLMDFRPLFEFSRNRLVFQKGRQVGAEMTINIWSVFEWKQTKFSGLKVGNFQFHIKYQNDQIKTNASVFGLISTITPYL